MDHLFLPLTSKCEETKINLCAETRFIFNIHKTSISSSVASKYISFESTKIATNAEHTMFFFLFAAFLCCCWFCCYQCYCGGCIIFLFLLFRNLGNGNEIWPVFFSALFLSIYLSICCFSSSIIRYVSFSIFELLATIDHMHSIFYKNKFLAETRENERDIRKNPMKKPKNRWHSFGKQLMKF